MCGGIPQGTCSAALTFCYLYSWFYYHFQQNVRFAFFLSIWVLFHSTLTNHTIAGEGEANSNSSPTLPTASERLLQRDLKWIWNKNLWLLNASREPPSYAPLTTIALNSCGMNLENISSRLMNEGLPYKTLWY